MATGAQDAEVWGRTEPMGAQGSVGIEQRSGVPNWDPGPLDGDFGSLTETAVKAFQTDNGLPRLRPIFGA